MKLAVVLVLVALMAVAFISGCVQETGITGELTGEQMEEEAFQTIEEEMEEALENMTMEELERELLE